KITSKEFRQIMGPKILSSTNFTVEVKGSAAYFTGYGWGHGVGFCQWGAFSMAKKGYDYKQILEYYYPGSEVVTLK
ncbi:MAG: cell division protein, partial [Candidatus Omnitrophica bacterium]|nr:cell division protein [Candidatus Omnitrophota bacterium]